MDHAKLLETYKLGKNLGRGQFGDVRAAEHRITGHQVAIKIINRKKIEIPEMVQQEISHHLCLQHKHIIRLDEVMETTECLYMIMELVSGGDLCDYIIRHGRLPENEARRIFRQLVASIRHCHGQQICHRDVKPENILLDREKNVKLADFGLSAKMCTDKLLTDSCGSPNYAAPELLVKKCSYDGCGVDVWSCGVILYAMLTGNLPFESDNFPRLFKRIRKGVYTIPFFMSDQARDLIAEMLRVNPSERISMSEILSHCWVTEGLPVEVSLQHTNSKTATECNLLEGDMEYADALVELASVDKSRIQSATLTLLRDPVVEYSADKGCMHSTSCTLLSRLGHGMQKLVAAVA